MKKEIWDWLHPKLCRNRGNHSIKNPLKAGRHALSSAAEFEKMRISSISFHMNTNDTSSFSPFGCWSDSRRMSGVDVDETEAVSGGVETLLIGVLGQLGGLDEEDRPSFDIQEKSHDLPNQIIQSLQPSDHGRIKEVYCRFSFLVDPLISRRKHRHDAFNAFDGREKNVESELELVSGNRSSVGRLKKLFGWKIDGSTSLHCQLPKLEKVKWLFLKKMYHRAKKSGGCLIQKTSKAVDASEADEQESNYVHFAPKEEEVDSQLGAADYRIMTDSDYVILEW